jgi:hypothetical protein
MSAIIHCQAKETLSHIKTVLHNIFFETRVQNQFPTKFQFNPISKIAFELNLSP